MAWAPGVFGPWMITGQLAAHGRLVLTTEEAAAGGVPGLAVTVVPMPVRAALLIPLPHQDMREEEVEEVPLG